MGLSSFGNIFYTLFCSCLHVLFLHEPNKKFPSSETFSATRLSGPKSKAVLSSLGNWQGPVWPTTKLRTTFRAVSKCFERASIKSTF